MFKPNCCSMFCKYYVYKTAAVLSFLVKMSSIHSSAQHGDLESIKHMIATDIDLVNTRDQYGNTALHLASAYGHLDIVKLLCGSDITKVDIKNNYGSNALSVAASAGQLEILQYLQPRCDNTVRDSIGNTALHWAAYNGHLNVVKYLVESAGCEVTSTNNNNETPLNEARNSGESEIALFLEETLNNLQKMPS